MDLIEIENNWEGSGYINDVEAQWLISRVKKLEEIVTLVVESQGWDGNNPDDYRWTEFYKKAREVVENR